jgi:hypothetical protein
MRWITDMPQCRLTIAGTVYDDENLVSASVERRENGWDTATVTLENSADLYPTPASPDATILIQVKEASASAYDTIFNGVIRFPVKNFGTSKALMLKCLGAGYPLGEMLVEAEYGTQGMYTLDNIQDILADATHGIIPKYVNKYLGSSLDSGYAIDATKVEDCTDVIPYYLAPYKPANKVIDDLCDLVTAYKAGGAGPHWIVDTSSNLRLKLIGTNQTGWTKYVDGATNTAGQATLTDTDFIEGSIEPQGKEANVIIYYGQWRRPSSGDAWTENTAALWGHTAVDVEVTADNTVKLVGEYSIRAEQISSGGGYFWYPLAKTAAWDFTSSFNAFNIPTLNFYARRSSNNFGDIAVTFYTDAANYFNYSLLSKLTSKDIWYHFSMPIGGYANQTETNDYAWEIFGAPDWTSINWIEFGFSNNNANEYIYIDGLHFGGAAVCRVAREKTPGAEGGTLGQSTNKIKMRLITDDQGKDDSLVYNDDSGLMGQLSYAELLRLQTQPTIQTFATRMAPSALPGQLINIAADYRTTKLTHLITKASDNGYATKWDVTTDVLNTRARPRYEDQNRLYGMIRPEWQDRQASSLKAGNVDIRITRLVHPGY